MSEEPGGAASSRPLQTAAYVVIVIAGLRAAASTLTPILMALLLALLCLGPMRWLQRHRVPDMLAVLLTFLTALVALFGVSLLVGDSIGEFNAAATTYQTRLETMVSDLEGWLGRIGLADMLDIEEGDLKQAVDSRSVLNLVREMLSGILSVLSNVFLVSFLLVFMLFEASNFPEKLRRALGGPAADLAEYRQILRSVNDYMVVKTGVSLLTGLAVGVMMHLLDIDFAVLWALVAFAFNFVPNIGSIIAAIPGVLLALIQYGPSTAGVVAGGYIAVNLVVGNVLEPRLLGNRLGLSPLVVFVSLLLWSWVFGPFGMLISAPLTAIVKIVLENTRDYRAFAVLLGPAVVEEEPSG
jgi:predicted PurR-regulated permease PerM